MFRNDELVMKRGMDCLSKNFSVLEIEIFISAITRSAYDYTQWRQEYFENAYKGDDITQLENFLNSAANNDPRGESFGL